MKVAIVEEAIGEEVRGEHGGDAEEEEGRRGRNQRREERESFVRSIRRRMSQWRIK